MKKIINPENEIESLRKSYENDSSYAHALKDLIEKNDSYGKIFAMSLLCLILNIAHKKWTTKDDIKKDFKNAVNLIIGSSDLDEKEKANLSIMKNIFGVSTMFRRKSDVCLGHKSLMFFMLQHLFFLKTETNRSNAILFVGSVRCV